MPRSLAAAGAVGRRSRRRPADRRARRRHDGTGRGRRARPLRAGAHASWSAPATPTSRPRPGASAPTSGAGRRARPGRAPPRRLPRWSATTCRAAPTPSSTPSARRPRWPRGLRITRPAWPGRADGHAGRGHARPHRACGTARPSSSARTPTAPRRCDGRRVRTFELAIDTADAIAAERWLSATYPLADHIDAIAHAAGAGRDQVARPRSVSDLDRCSSEYEPPTGPPVLGCRTDGDADLTWVRPRRRPLDPTDAVLARRGVQPREVAARPQPGDLRPRAAPGARRHRRRHPPRPRASRRRRPAARPAVPGDEAHDRLRRREPAAAARCAGPTSASG